MKKNKLAFWFAPSWFIITTVLLCLPGSVFPQKNWFDKIWLDKWIHVGLFAVMVFLWCWFIRNLWNRRNHFFIQIFFYCFLYGITMEFIQKYFIPNRSFEINDIIADGIGSALGLLISLRRV
ncbi:MAG: VanZ family protein [Chitinophagales bacterium]